MKINFFLWRFCMLEKNLPWCIEEYNPYIVQYPILTTHWNILMYLYSNLVYCRSSDGQRWNCFKCMIISQKHHNVLQYKESKYITFWYLFTYFQLLFFMFRQDYNSAVLIHTILFHIWRLLRFWIFWRCIFPLR